MTRRRLVRSVTAVALAAGLVVTARLAAAADPPAPETPSLDEARVERVVGPPRGPRLSGTTLDLRTKEVAALLRCPVCQGLSVGDSPSGMAQKMREEVRDMVAAGFDEEQVLDYFEASYGEFVRLEPPLRGVNWIVWLAPLIGLLGGALVVGWALRRSRTGEVAAVPEGPGSGAGTAVPAAPTADDVPDRDTLPDDADLAPWVLRVREIAYGWPGGVSPRQDGA